MLQWIHRFREIHVPRAWLVYLATESDFRRKKNGASFGSTGARLCRQPPTLPLYYMKEIFPQNFVHVLRTKARHMVSFIDFYGDFVNLGVLFVTMWINSC